MMGEIRNSNVRDLWVHLSDLVQNINDTSRLIAEREFFVNAPTACPSLAHPELCLIQVVSRLYRLFRESGRKCLPVFETVLRGRMAPDTLNYLRSGLDVVTALRHLEHHQPGANYAEHLRDTEHWFLTVTGTLRPSSDLEFLQCSHRLLVEANEFLSALSSWLIAAARDPVELHERRKDILSAHEGVDPAVFTVAFNNVWKRFGLPFSKSIRSQLQARWSKFSWGDVPPADLVGLTERWLLTHAVSYFPLPLTDDQMLTRLGLSGKYRHWITLFGLCVYRQALMDRREFEERLVGVFHGVSLPEEVPIGEIQRLIELVSTHPDPRSLLQMWSGLPEAAHT